MIIKFIMRSINTQMSKSIMKLTKKIKRIEILLHNLIVFPIDYFSLDFLRLVAS